MAIAWEVKITVLDYNQKHVFVVGTRTDSAAPQNIRTYTVGPRHVDTTAQRSLVMDEIWALRRVADVVLDAKKTTFASVIVSLEAAVKTNLEAREV